MVFLQNRKGIQFKYSSMQEYQLGFISDKDIYEHVRNTVMQYRRQINLQEFNKNIVDPIKLTFDAKIYGKSMREIIESECIRQIDKSNNNTIGYFHQHIFKYANAGWIVSKTGFDIENMEKHIFVELKNKHNTMNSASSQKTYLNMQNKILEDDKAVCMLVEVIAKKSQNVKWEVTVGSKKFSHERIRRVSVDQFYNIVFSEKNCFFKLCNALPHILDDVIANENSAKLQNTVYKELANSNFMKSLYLLAFRTYEGFEAL